MQDGRDAQGAQYAQYVYYTEVREPTDVDGLRPITDPSFRSPRSSRTPKLTTSTWGSCRLSLMRFPAEAYLFLDELGRFGRVARIERDGRGATAQILIGDREDLDSPLFYKHIGASLALPGLTIFDGLRRRKYPELRGLIEASKSLLQG